MVMLPKLLTLTLNKNNTKEEHLDHIKKYKALIEKIPSSSLFQTAPEGTDVESYVSVEADDGSTPTPIFPFVLWLTSDYCSGKLYLKIDKKFVFLGNVAQGNSHAVIRALEVCMEAHHVFNLQYHPYLCSYYDYLEYLLGMKAPMNSLNKFITAIRQLMP
ncbi:uncharacterized protein LOC127750698 [Frankliniella occidentalis]|uniref:Uncharacterized protein LOC127750698 n=1 Tax=Frankliniella occidentalis TaxID=133901 RepID=A0A9C6X4F1_FRAOC|nr:uncharacterized protein LOC127750698 [Frankliniella occidentalis]